IFDWMGRQKRKAGMPELSQFVSNRTTDDRFYWLSAEGIADSCINDYAKWKKWPFPQATLQGRITPDNTIRLTNVMHWKKVTVWISRDMVPVGQPGKPVTMTIQVNNVSRIREIKPSLTVLLEDFYQRGDRQRLFVAKEELTVTGR